MSMPQFPPQPYRPDLHLTIIDLLDSIALEEVALSHLLNAEAEKIQQFLRLVSSCTHPDVVIDFSVIVNETLETVIMKEWLLLRKLEKVTRFFNKQFPPPCPPVCPPVPPCPQVLPSPQVVPSQQVVPIPQVVPGQQVPPSPIVHVCQTVNVKISCNRKRRPKKRVSIIEE